MSRPTKTRRNRLPGPAIELLEDGPLIVVRFHREATEAEFELYLRRLDVRLGKRRVFGFLYDTRALPTVPRPLQKMQAEWIRRQRPLLTERSLGSAILIQSATMRFVLSAVFLIQRPPKDYAVVGTWDEAIAWLEETFAAAGHPLPSSAASLDT